MSAPRAGRSRATCSTVRQSRTWSSTANAQRDEPDQTHEELRRGEKAERPIGEDDVAAEMEPLLLREREAGLPGGVDAGERSERLHREAEHADGGCGRPAPPGGTRTQQTGGRGQPSGDSLDEGRCWTRDGGRSRPASPVIGAGVSGALEKRAEPI